MSYVCHVFGGSRRVHVGGLLRVDGRGVVGLRRVDAEGVQHLDLVAVLQVHPTVGARLAGHVRRVQRQVELHVQPEVAEGLHRAQVAAAHRHGAIGDSGHCGSRPSLCCHSVRLAAVEQRDALAVRPDGEHVQVHVTGVRGLLAVLDHVVDPRAGAPWSVTVAHSSQVTVEGKTVCSTRSPLTYRLSCFVAGVRVRAVAVAHRQVVRPGLANVDGRCVVDAPSLANPAAKPAPE